MRTLIGVAVVACTVFGLATGSVRAGDMSVAGKWVGHYYYEKGGAPDGKNTDELPVEFHASLRESDGGFSGEIRETTLAKPDDPKPTELRSAVTGSTDPRGLVTFIKKYDGAGGWVHAVAYSGVLDPAHQTIQGKWVIGDTSGRFEMHREK